jgi:Uma2 family endonuclease
MRPLEETKMLVGELVRPLSRADREDLADWLVHSEEFREPVRMFGDRVAEVAPAYGSPGSSYMSLEEYLKFEGHGSLKYEYLAGRIFAMSPPKMRHGAIVRNVISGLEARLREGPCQAFPGPGVQIRWPVGRDDLVYEPDVVVSCRPQDMEDQLVSEPRMIIEVLSPSTERIDRGEKVLNYRLIESLEEYVVIAQRIPEVTVYRRSERWAPLVITALDAGVDFSSIGVSLPLNVIYANTQ